MKKIVASLLVLPFLISITGCTTAKISGRGTQPLVLNQLNGETESVGRIDKKEMKTFDYTGAIDVSEIIGGKLSQSNADALTNTTVTMGSSPGTFFLNLVTLGIANAYTATVEGDLVRIESPSASAIQPPALDSIKTQPGYPSKASVAEIEKSRR